MKRLKGGPALAALSMAALLTSCTVGPKYTKPAVPAAPTFSEAPPKAFEGWMPGQPNDTQLRGSWWEMFGESAAECIGSAG